MGDVPNTGSPVAANASTEANDHQSLAAVDSAPSMTSGAMKPGVPITSPVLVTWLSPGVIAMPKSTSTGPVTEIITLVGLMSRCTIPRLMHCMHGVDELAGEPFEIVSHILAVMANILTQIFALDEFGHQECQRIVYLHVDNLADSRIADLAHSHGLTAQALTGDHLRAVFGRIRIAVVGSESDARRIFIAYALPPPSTARHTEPMATGTKA